MIILFVLIFLDINFQEYESGCTQEKVSEFFKICQFPFFFFFFFCSLQTVMPIVEAYLSPPDKFVPEPGIT